MRITKRLRKGANALAALAAGLMLFGAAACSHDSGGSEDRKEGGDAGTITLYKNGASQGEKSSIAEALKAISETGTDEWKIELTAGTYNETEQLTYRGSATIKITGKPKTALGKDVIIKGVGSDYTQESGRSMFEIRGTGDTIIEYVTMEHAHKATVVPYTGTDGKQHDSTQREVIGHQSTGTFAAYNCSFISYQDTIRTESKAWFYKCYIEGDVDFLWIEESTKKSKVALYEDCDLHAVAGRKSSVKAYFAAPRLTPNDMVGKGVVIWKSRLEADEALKEVYLGRNPWDKATDEEKKTSYFESYYENIAIIDSTWTGKQLNSNWYGSGPNTPVEQKFIGFKTDSYFSATSGENGVVIDDDLVEAEYSDRNKILNRVYNVEEEKFENDAASGIWNIAALETEFGAQASGELPKENVDPESAKVTWNFAGTLNGETTTEYNSKSGMVTGTVNGSDEYTVKMHVNAENGKFRACETDGDTQMNKGTVLTVPVTNGSVVTVAVRSNGTVGIEGTETNTYTHSGDATGIVIYATGDVYITEVAVNKLDLTVLDDGLKDATAEGSVRAIVLGDSAKEIMNGNTYELNVTQYTSYGADDGTVSWETDNESVASVSNDGTVTANADSGTATITATVNGHSATCEITAVPKTEVSKYTFDFSTNFSGTVAATEDTSKTLTVGNGISYHGSTYGAQGTGTVQFPVPGNCTVTFYPTYKMAGTVTLYKSGDTSTQLGTASIDISTVDAKIGFTGTQEPSQYAKKITYTGDAQTVDLVIEGSNVYFWKIVVEKTN